MKIFSYWTQQPAPQRIDNAAPVQPNPFAGQFRTPGMGGNRFTGSGAPVANPFAGPELPTLRVLAQDTFTRASGGQPQAAPLNFSGALDWLNRHSLEAFQNRLTGHLKEGSHEGLRQAVTLLNAANRSQKLVFAGEQEKTDFGRNYRLAVEALMTGEPTVNVFLNRALRGVTGFQGMTPVTTPAPKPANPFRLS